MSQGNPAFWMCLSKITLPQTNSSHLKMDGWNTILSFWDGLFSGAMLVSGRVGDLWKNNPLQNTLQENGVTYPTKQRESGPAKKIDSKVP